MTFITQRAPPANRVGSHDGDHERLLSEPAVMLAMAEWLFDQGAAEVRIHPDGMHMKGFDIPSWLTGRGFTRLTTTGRGKIAGTFRRGSQNLVVHSRPGLGDVIATIDGVETEIEAKGGCINSRHPGQLSRLRKGLHEAVGQLMASPRTDLRLIAAVPRHSDTERLAQRLLSRCVLAGVEIALVDEDGVVELMCS